MVSTHNPRRVFTEVIGADVGVARTGGKPPGPSIEEGFEFRIAAETQFVGSVRSQCDDAFDLTAVLFAVKEDVDLRLAIVVFARGAIEEPDHGIGLIGKNWRPAEGLRLLFDIGIKRPEVCTNVAGQARVVETEIKPQFEAGG